MNKRPGHVKVTIEIGYCSFCDRTRNLRREERQLGALVRTVIACESCHRLLSSSIGVASAEPAVESEVPAVPDDSEPVGVETKPRAVKRAPVAPKPKAASAKAPAPKSRAQRSK